MGHPKVVKRFVKIGNVHGLVLPKAMLDALGITPENPEVVIRTDGGALLGRPITPGRKTVPAGLVKKVAWVGYSGYLYLDKAVMDLVGMSLEEDVQIVSDGKAFVVQRHPPNPLAAENTGAQIDKVVMNAVEMVSTRKAS